MRLTQAECAINTVHQYNCHRLCWDPQDADKTTLCPAQTRTCQSLLYPSHTVGHPELAKVLGLQQQPLDRLRDALQASWPAAEGVRMHESLLHGCEARPALAGGQLCAQHVPDNVEAHAGLRLPCQRCTVSSRALLYVWSLF